MLLRILKGVALTTAVAAVSVVALGAAVAAKRSDRMVERPARVDSTDSVDTDV